MMEIIFILFAALVAIDLAAWKWGCDSREVVDSPEWERLHNWRGFH
jgi:hypothetical protein